MPWPEATVLAWVRIAASREDIACARREENMRASRRSELPHRPEAVFGPSRRSLLTGAAGVFGTLALPVRAQPAAGPQDGITVTLLGTGTPVPLPDRFGSST